MVEGEMFKTRLCQQYLRGRCTRHYCNFAHGDSDLRRTIPKRQENQDLRHRLNRIRSPPGRLFHGDTSHRSVRTRIDRHHSKRQQLDNQGNYSGSLRLSDEIEDQIKDRKHTSPDFKLRMDDKLRQMDSEIKMLDNEKRQLENHLGDKVQEADTLKVKIHELETRLSKQKEESKRITTRIKKFIKAHKRHRHIQEELKSSNAQLQKLGEQLDLDATGPGYEAGPNIIDDEAGGKFSSSLNESPVQKRTCNFLEVHGTSNRVSPVDEDIGKIRLDKLPRLAEYHDQSNNNKELETDGNSNNEHMSFTLEDKPEKETSLPSDSSADKYEVSEAAITPTGLTAHVMDENVVEVNEMEEKLPEVGAASETQGLPFLPPPPPIIPQNILSEYKGNGADVNISGPEEEPVEVDVE